MRLIPPCWILAPFSKEEIPTASANENGWGITTYASPDEMVVKVYPLDHETTYLRASFERRRARNPGGGIALAGCLHLTPLPDPARQLSGRECLPDRPRAGMQPANRPQRHPRLQREGSPASASSRLQTSAHRSQGLPGSSTGRGLAGAFAPHAQGLRKRHKPVDAGLGRRGQLRRRPYRRAHHGRERPGDACADGGTLGASQEVDRFPGSRVREKKRRRDRLIGLAEGLPEWGVGFLDESWFSRLARPAL